MTIIVMTLLYVWAAVFAALIVWLSLYYMGLEIYPIGKGKEGQQEQETIESNQIFNK